MKKILSIFIFLSLIAGANKLYAQDYVREGNTFTRVQEEKKSEDIQTQYVYEDYKHKKYFIWLTKNNCAYVLKESSRTGNTYKYYLSKEIAETIAKELGREVKKEPEVK